MFLSYRRRRRCRPLFRILFLSFLIFNFFDVFVVHRSFSAARNANFLESRGLPLNNEKIYISSIHWNSEVVLKSGWAISMIKLIQTLGPENVYVSIYESGSWDETKFELRALDAELEHLNVRRTIVLDETTHEDEIGLLPIGAGWITTPRGKRELRRIPYLSRLRNWSLKPMEDLESCSGERFDKLLMLNDVLFSTRDVLNLLDTNGGEYAAACSLDFSNPTNFYDTFALRDAEGYEHLMQNWPYFRARKSRQAMKANAPVPVKSCWNGMVAMTAEPFYYNISSSSSSTTYSNDTPLRFRGIPDSLATSHLEASECCLIHADNPLSQEKGVWLNPNVRVAYNSATFDRINDPLTPYPSSGEILRLLWTNRLRRWFTTLWLKTYIVNRRVRKWRIENPGSREDGGFCLINEMQVLVHNGWLHV